MVTHFEGRATVNDLCISFFDVVIGWNFTVGQGQRSFKNS